MSAGIAALGIIAAAFGLASQRILGEWNPFNVTNLVFGGAAIAVAVFIGLRAIGRVRHPADRGPMLDALLSAVAIAWGAGLVLFATTIWGVRLDWTFEQRYSLAPATEKVLDELNATGAPVSLSLYYLEGDPRRRATSLLLEEMARGRNITTQVQNLDEAVDDEDYYGIGSSNSVVVTTPTRWELVERPSEGGLYEALSRLAHPPTKIAYATMGTGEGDLEAMGDGGYTGLRAALETEGYEVRPLPTALLDRVPADADLVLMIAPQRRLTDAALAAVRAWLEGGRASLLAFVEPGVQSGLEEVLAEYGLASPDAVLIDPTAAPIDGDAAGLNPVARHYGDHPVSTGLNQNRMTFFRRTRSFTLHKPEANDTVRPVVHASGSSWLYENPSALTRGRFPEKPDDARTDYYALAVAGSYARGTGETRIVAFGDADFATNRYLRALYNLDLMMNAVHWSTQRDAAITIRPKSGQLLQFPVPIQQSLNALYGVGLLVPELLVMMGAWIWLRRRAG